ncbi:unnamed protein product [Onchocerca flexuosa]|uniref:Transmembrane protein n=1 Tax=Onchocerca flexuosa TaxID=387005 RepID=A0A183I8Q0_9BILA|nr:unnamed protein product [Onchocerca flexuosa]
MGNRPYLYSVYGNKRRRLESTGQQMVSSSISTSNDDCNGNFGFFGFMTRFFAPVTNLFRSSVKTVTTEGMCSSNSNSTFSGHLNKRSTNGTAQRIEEKGTSESMSMVFQFCKII